MIMSLTQKMNGEKDQMKKHLVQNHCSTTPDSVSVTVSDGGFKLEESDDGSER
jgi:hypothetical protein